MLGSAAVTRINDALGFRPPGHSLEGTILLRLQEAQDELEGGKTLPKFLLQEDQTITLAAGAHTAPLPVGFLRESDDARIRIYEAGVSAAPRFLSRKIFIDATKAQVDITPGETSSPQVYVVRKSTLDFIVPADRNYTLYWDYFKAAAVVTSDSENEWLASKWGRWWLIGEAGIRIASDLRDVNAAEIFNSMASKARASLFGETIAAEEASGPFMMGAQL